jgi:hypothetical protein
MYDDPKLNESLQMTVGEFNSLIRDLTAMKQAIVLHKKNITEHDAPSDWDEELWKVLDVVEHAKWIK